MIAKTVTQSNLILSLAVLAHVMLCVVFVLWAIGAVHN